MTVDCLPHTNLYTKRQILTTLGPFVKRWKVFNFLRRTNKPLSMSDTELSVATSCKTNSIYHLYRGLKSHMPKGNVYKDLYPSSWSLNKSIAQGFGKTVMHIEVTSDRVFLDLDYLRHDSEQEVILLPGEYQVDMVQKKPVTKSPKSPKSPKTPKTPKTPKPLLTLAMITALDLPSMKKLLSLYTIPQIKAFCRTEHIAGYSNRRKADLVNYVAIKIGS